MKITILKYFLLLNLLFVLISACKKQDEFLDEKPNLSLAVPVTLEDFQLLLNNNTVFNLASQPALGTISSDEYYATSADWASAFTPEERNAYIFSKDIFQSTLITNEWWTPYRQVYYSNIILEGIEKIDIKPAQQSQYDQIKGSALFFRALAFYDLLGTFSLPYDSATANTDLGIPLRLNSDINVKSVRATVKEGYDQVTQDLKASLLLLSDNSIYKTQPSKTAALALLARVTLSMRNYALAYHYANNCLSAYNTLVDFNTLTPTTFAISTSFIAEVLYHNSLKNYDVTARNTAIVDSTLFNSYDNNDLRKTIFFSTVGGQIRFRGTYDYQGNKFSGLATDEMYLIRAECSARAGNTSAAMKDLNDLLRTRWKKIGGITTYTDQVALDANDALTRILRERKKELIFRGIRWTDLRRLNKEGQFLTTVTHIINGITYTLPPNSPLYVMPIPNDEIQLNGLPQNPR
jgi:hypothetical protein